MSDCCQHCQAEIFCIGKMPPGHQVDCLRCQTTVTTTVSMCRDATTPPQSIEASSMLYRPQLNSGISHIHDLIVRRAIEPG